MKLETFFEKFDQFADAPDAVAKMRGLILRLAMQGKLSEHHKTDGPVSELLREVEKDKMRLGLETSAKATSGNSDFSDDETADLIPARWTWVRFGNIARHNAGKTLDKGRNRGELRDYITTSNLYWGFFQLDAVRQMPMLDDELERCTAIKGDLLICEGGEAGRAAVWPQDREISFQNHVHRARFFAGINPYFVQRYFEKLNATGEIEKYRKGVGISNMSGKALASIPIPVPPLAEQKRIVAKVDELMALCDRLEAQQQERETRHAALARASLARFALNPQPSTLNFLFHPSYAIPPADLRKSILTLAVQGKLVPQDPNEEPAEEREVGALVTENEEPEIEPPFALPDSWQAARVREVLVTRQGVQIEKAEQLSEPKLGYKRYLYISDFKHDQKLKFVRDEHPTKEVTVDDLVMANTAGPGEIFRGVPGILSNNLFKISFAATQFCQDFLFIYFTSPCFVEAVGAELKGGAQQHLGHKLMGKQFIPVPPLAEQRRIVAKVEQLMALVDALEQKLAASRATAANLLSALVAELTATA